MSRLEWAHRVVGRTRGEILGWLCRGPRTVGEVSKALGLTPNGVRSHLSALEADGLVKLIGSKRQVGKPAHLFELTAAGRALLSTAYQPVLEAVLDAVWDHDSSVVENILRTAGQRVAVQYPKATGDVRARAERGAAILGDLGGIAEVEEDGSAWVIRAMCCPLGAVVPDHPEICKLIETLLGDVLGEPIQEFCKKNEPPHCQFRLEAVPKRKRSVRAR